VVEVCFCGPHMKKKHFLAQRLHFYQKITFNWTAIMKTYGSSDRDWLMLSALSPNDSSWGHTTKRPAHAFLHLREAIYHCTFISVLRLQ
jgi:hypothetical protein